MPFPNTVNVQAAPAVVGDFASSNPRATVLSGAPGATLVAGAAGATIGRFGWLDKAAARLVTNAGVGLPAGFIGRELNAAITTWLAETSLLIPAGRGVPLYTAGDFWVVNSGAAAVVPGMKAYALYASGLAAFAATGTPPQGSSVTASIAAIAATSVTASIAAPAANVTAPSVMTVTAVGSGTVVVGGTLSGSGVVTGTTVVAQLTGTPGGVGTYSVSIPQTVASTTITVAAGTLTVTAVASGAVTVGQVLSGSGVTAGTVVTALGTGTGGTGTYIVSPSQTAASTAIVGTAGIETKWVAMSYAAPGELVAMTSNPIG